MFNASETPATDRDLLAALHIRVEAQEQAIHVLQAKLRQAHGQPRWRPLATVLGLLLLVVASFAVLPATRAQQSAADAAEDKTLTPNASGDPLLIGRVNNPSIVSGVVDTTSVVDQSTTQLAPRLLRAANYSDADVGSYFATDTYRVAVLGSTSGVDDQTRVRVGVAGAVDTSQTGSFGGFGVYGYAKGPVGYGLAGFSENGVGAILTGKQAPLLLSPSTTNGPPTSGIHTTGELYVSMDGNLYFCTATGTPGQWTQLNLLHSYVPVVNK